MVLKYITGPAVPAASFSVLHVAGTLRRSPTLPRWSLRLWWWWMKKAAHDWVILWRRRAKRYPKAPVKHGLPSKVGNQCLWYLKPRTTCFLACSSGEERKHSREFNLLNHNYIVKKVVWKYFTQVKYLYMYIYIYLYRERERFFCDALQSLLEMDGLTLFT